MDKKNLEKYPDSRCVVFNVLIHFEIDNDKLNKNKITLKPSPAVPNTSPYKGFPCSSTGGFPQPPA